MQLWSRKAHRRSVEREFIREVGKRQTPTYLIDMIRVGAIHFDRMRGKFRIQTKSAVQMVRDKLRVDSPLWEDSISEVSITNLIIEHDGLACLLIEASAN